MAGRIEVVTGCMFSGKTEEFIRRLRRLRFARQSYVAFKPSTDDRYGLDRISTHNALSIDAYLLEPGRETLSGLFGVVASEELHRAHVVAFEEVQFFSDNLSLLCKELAAMGKRVIVAGLDTNFRYEPFGPMPALLALADEILKLSAVCVVCGEPATRTQRLVNGKPITEGPEVLIGGSESYEPRCRECWQGPR